MLTGSLSRLGNLFRTLSGSLTFSGIVTGLKLLPGVIESILSYGGVISRLLNLNRVYSGILTISGIVTTPFKYYSLSGQFDSSGSLTRQAFFFRTITSGLAPSAIDSGEASIFFGEIYLDMTMRI